MLKTGQSIKVEGRWGIVTYLIGDLEAIVTFDDDRQVKVGVEDLLPVVIHAQRSVAQKERPGRCLDCGTGISAGATRCSACQGLNYGRNSNGRGRDIVLNPFTHPHDRSS